VVLALIFLSSLRIFYSHTGIPSDIATHMTIIKPYMEGSYYIPHPAFEIAVYCLSKVTRMPFEFMIPLMMSTAVVWAIWLVKKQLGVLLPGIKSDVVLFMSAGAVNFVIAVYLPFFNETKYLGQWSPNVWHNPSLITLKPFAVVTFFGFLGLLERKDRSDMTHKVGVSLFLLLCTTIKPSFTICFLPAVAVIVLLFYRRRLDIYVQTIVMAAPSVALLVYQFVMTYELRRSSSYFHDSIMMTWFGVLKLYTPSVAISALLVTLFPLCVLAGSRDNEHRILYTAGWTMALVGFLQAAFLAEKIKFGEGAFISGYIIGLFFLFLVSIIQYLSWFTEQNRNATRPVLRYCVLAVFVLHLVSGLWYYIDMFQGKTIF
jgi:hypothetical protein